MPLSSECLILSLMEPFFSSKSNHLTMGSSVMNGTETVDVMLAI